MTTDPRSTGTPDTPAIRARLAEDHSDRCLCGVDRCEDEELCDFPTADTRALCDALDAANAENARLRTVMDEQTKIRRAYLKRANGYAEKLDITATENARQSKMIDAVRALHYEVEICITARSLNHTIYVKTCQCVRYSWPANCPTLAVLDSPATPVEEAGPAKLSLDTVVDDYTITCPHCGTVFGDLGLQNAPAHIARCHEFIRGDGWGCATCGEGMYNGHHAAAALDSPATTEPPAQRDEMIKFVPAPQRLAKDPNGRTQLVRPRSRREPDPDWTPLGSCPNHRLSAMPDGVSYCRTCCSTDPAKAHEKCPTCDDTMVRGHLSVVDATWGFDCRDPWHDSPVGVAQHETFEAFGRAYDLERATAALDSPATPTEES